MLLILGQHLEESKENHFSKWYKIFIVWFGVFLAILLKLYCIFLGKVFLKISTLSLYLLYKHSQIKKGRMTVMCKQSSFQQGTKMHASMCCFGNCPALFLCSWQHLWWPINSFSAVDKMDLARMAAGSHSSASLMSWFSALNCSYFLQVWLPSQAGAVSSLKESPAAAFTGAHILSSLISICFWEILWVTWKQVFPHFLWLRNQCIPTLAGNRFRHLPCPGFHRSLDPSM